jgi:carboxyl-terminal processing protease
MKRSILLFIICTMGTIIFGQDPTYRQKLYYTCKVWGFVKYYHSRVSICQVNWDSVLLQTLPHIKNAVTQDEFNDALDTMLLAAGPMEIATSPSPDTLPSELKKNLNFGWILDPVLRNEVKVILDTIKNNFRPHAICWVNNSSGSNSFLGFPFDNPMIDTNTYINYPSEFTRLLVLFKYWNIINYFNPYNYVQDNPWDSTLYKNAVAVATAPDYITFFKIIKKITAYIDDAHVEGMTSCYAFSVYGNYSSRIILWYTHDNYVVVKSGYDSIIRGDIIVSIDGKTPRQWEDSLRPYISAGNPSVFRRFMCQYMLCGDNGSQSSIVYKDSLGNEHSQSAVRDLIYFSSWFYSYFPNDTLGTVKWKKWSCNVGYVNIGTLMSTDGGPIYDTLKNTNAIIFDIRNYPNFAAWDIANLMYPNYKCFTKMTIPDIDYPGTYYWYYEYLGNNGNDNYYKGQVIILCNQETQSQAELLCMALKGMPNAVIVGSQTAGTDGNVTFFQLSNDISSGFTTLGVYFPEGDSTERIGIVPDSVVYPTQRGIRQGRDEVLEKALQVAGCLSPIFAINPTEQNVTAPGGETSFDVTCNTNWSAVSDATWCIVTSSGSGNGTINADYTENTLYQPRTAIIQVSVAGQPLQTVKVNQSKSTQGIEEVRDDGFQIYPNPANNKINIASHTNQPGETQITFFKLTGEQVLQEKSQNQKLIEIDVSMMIKGIYFVKIQTRSGIETTRLVIL